MGADQSPIGLGTAAIGRPHYINLRQESAPPFSLPDFRARGIQVLEQAYQNGIRYFDTAPGYGIAEDLLIEWLDKHSDRTLEVATKWGYTYTANFQLDAEKHEVKEHSLAKLKEQWERSQALIPHLTTYQIHSATFASGVLENAAVLDRLAEIKATYGLRMGLTTSGDKQLEVLKRSLEISRDEEDLFDVFQVTYNVLDQSLGEMIRELGQAGKRVVIKEALANGRLFPTERYPHYAPLYAELQRLAGKYQVGVDAIALRYCIDSVAPFKVLSGASQEQHLTDNLTANGFRLEAEELHTLGQFAVPRQTYWAERKLLSWN